MPKQYSNPLLRAVNEGNVERTGELIQDPSTNVNAVESHYNALHVSMCAKKKDCFDLLMTHPGIDVNAVPYETSALALSCFRQWEYYFDLLMAHPDININSKERRGNTVLGIACENRNVHAVKALLSRPELDVDTDTLCSGALFEMICSAGSFEIVKLFLIHCTGPAKRNKHHLCSANPLIDRYNAGRAPLKARLCAEMGVKNPDRVEMYALMVCLSDGYFEQKAGEENSFLSIAARLPQELQMILANRTYGVPGDFMKAPITNRMLLRMLADNNQRPVSLNKQN